LTASAPASAARPNRCLSLCNRIAACNVPVFWGVPKCMEYCRAGKYEPTMRCLEQAIASGCAREPIETCVDPCH
jgi:hypothetical protein